MEGFYTDRDENPDFFPPLEGREWGGPHLAVLRVHVVPGIKPQIPTCKTCVMPFDQSVSQALEILTSPSVCLTCEIYFLSPKILSRWQAECLPLDEALSQQLMERFSEKTREKGKGWGSELKQPEDSPAFSLWWWWELGMSSHMDPGE